MKKINYRNKIIQEIKFLPEEVLPKVFKLVHSFNDREAKVSEIVQKALVLSEERKSWSRDRHWTRFLDVAEEIRQEAIGKGVAIENEEEAAIDD